ncbi:MAG: YgiQ family radical SAM protein [Thermodesulfobacteriota bacterium]|nr:YgiQ family radical SAM protein [Thermodesulfobacteriota bacterium]
MFLPTTKKEFTALGWKKADIILVTGDTYIDSPYTGVAVIGKTLVKQGFKVGVVAQPDMESDIDITRLGEPELFWGITSGSVDSMVANYTASKKWRKKDDYTPGGKNNRRPDRAVIAYTNLVKRYFKHTCPIVLGGIEASLRRICHYDFWSNKIRRSILFDAKADYLVYGMGEAAVVQLALALQRQKRKDANNICESTNYRNEKSSINNRQSGLRSNNRHGRSMAAASAKKSKILTKNESYLSSNCWTDFQINHISKIKGICYISKTPIDDYIEIFPYSEVSKDKKKFTESFHTFYNNNDPLTAKGITQKQDARYLVQNPPALYPDIKEMDKIYDLEFERDVHPYYKKNGRVRAMDTIQFSISTHRGCYGECNFCAIAVHEGRTVRWRSEGSILREVKAITKHPKFKGIISDAGGPTANMYGFECKKKLTKGACRDKRCLFPTVCKSLKPDHSNQIKLFQKIEKVKGVKKVFANSGIRYDLMENDKKNGMRFFETIFANHISGQMKVAPEHSESSVLKLMAKPDVSALIEFKRKFDALSKKTGKKQFLTYYLIAAHPGCTMEEMRKLKDFTRNKLKITPEQVQIFTPTPSTYSTLMYYTEQDPFTGRKLFVEKHLPAKEKQKHTITGTMAKKPFINKSYKISNKNQNSKRSPSFGRKNR